MLDIPIFKFAIREDLVDTGKLFLPTRGTSRSTGWDVRAAPKDRESITIAYGEHIKIPLGFRAFVPDGFWYELKPRSSTFGKKRLHSLYGTIDEDFEGELVFACQYLPCGNDTGSMRLSIDFGEAIGQIIPVKRQEMIISDISNDEFTNLCLQRSADRGDGGFGSTSK